jgi:nucleotide-binding universal stress UspA family protein
MKTASCILAATDFSVAATGAVRRAAMIAGQFGAALHVLHVVPPLNLYPGLSIDPVALDQEALDAAGQRLDTLLPDLAEEYGIRTHAAWRIGRVHAQIAEYAREVMADLVVMGARGDHSRMRSFLGSTTSRLLRVRSGPLLVVRRPNWPYKHVLAAVDFSADSYAALAWARQLADGAHLDVLHVIDPELERHLPPQARDGAHADMRSIAASMMQDLLSGLSGDPAAHVEMGHVPTRIFELAKTWHSDLIVVGRHGHGGLETYLLGSVSKDISQAAECDVLVAGVE